MANYHNHSGHHNNRNRDNQNRDSYNNRDNRGRDGHHRENSNRERDNQVINSFVLGTKELDDKTSEFQYDKGWYIITDIVGEEKNQVYKSKNAQEAYTKWNVYIGRKKERPQRVDKNAERAE